MFASMRRQLLLVLPLVGLLGACGGGNPQAPTSPSPGEPVYSVAAVVFYDENGNGKLDAKEVGRIPNAAVTVAGRTGTSSTLSGAAMVNSVPAGHQQVSIRADSLPPFYLPPAPLDVDVPVTTTLELPVTLPIGTNLTNRYMAFGDSITVGDGSSDGYGYTLQLEDQLRLYYGVGEVVNEGIDGTRTDQGAIRLGGSLARQHPAWTLIHYGTNDWNKCGDVDSCFTGASLRSMVQQVKAAGGLAALATIIPVNVGYDARTPPSRDDFVADQDALIRIIAREEGAVLVDLEPAFYKAGGTNMAALFSDHVHPNDRGYQVIANEFFSALTTRKSGTTSLLPSLDALPALEFRAPVESGWSRPERLGLRRP
jgi:acyl-CoA thioesterase I